LTEKTGVLFASSEIDEVLGLADRVLVMRDGRIVAEFPAQEANRQTVLEYATGAKA
jgi:ABC-type sugar transport system ATPase subunit